MKKICVLAWPGFDKSKVNPYNYQLLEYISNSKYFRILSFNIRNVVYGKYHIWHIHWPAENVFVKTPLHTIQRIALFFIVVLIVKIKRSKIVWTMHNHQMHDRPFSSTQNTFYNLLIRVTNGFIFLSDTSRRTASKRYPSIIKKRSAVIPHGHYKNYYPNILSRENARNRLGIATNSLVFLIFGEIRPYKKHIELMNIFMQAENKSILVIAGRCDDHDLLNQVTAIANTSDGRIMVYSKFIPDNEVQIYFNAADAIVLPYDQTMNSGVALLGLSFSRPIITTNYNAVKDLLHTVGGQWVRCIPKITPGTFEEFSSSLSEHHLMKFDDEYAWTNVGEDTMQHYRSLFV